VGNCSRKVKIGQSQRKLFSIHAASVCGRRAGKVKRRRRDGGNGVGAQRRRRAADGSPPLLRPTPIAARDERAVLRSGTGRRREGYGAADSPWSAANRALVTADKVFRELLSRHVKKYCTPNNWPPTSSLRFGLKFVAKFFLERLACHAIYSIPKHG
jgi:hypothetical protein